MIHDSRIASFDLGYENIIYKGPRESLDLLLRGVGEGYETEEYESMGANYDYHDFLRIRRVHV